MFRFRVSSPLIKYYPLNSGDNARRTRHTTTHSLGRTHHATPPHTDSSWARMPPYARPLRIIRYADDVAVYVAMPMGSADSTLSLETRLAGAHFQSLSLN